MADFTRWSIACEQACQEACTFITAYDKYREEAVDIVLDDDLVADALTRQMEAPPLGEFGCPELKTTSKELLEMLAGQVTEQQRRSNHWPRSPEKLARRLTSLAPALRQAGIVMKRLPREGKRRPWLRGGRESDRVVVQSEGDEVAARIEVGRKRAAQRRARDWWRGQDWPEAID